MNAPLSLNLGDRLERLALRLPHLSASAPVLHHFGPGIYIREVRMVPGLAVGHRHRLPHLNVMQCGRLTLIDEVTGAFTEMGGRNLYTAPPGRKIAIVHEETVWWNIIATSSTDPVECEALMLDKSEAWQTTALVQRAVATVLRQPERDDFDRFLAETGLSREFVRGVSVNTADLMPMPEGWPKAVIRDSAIEGKGVFVSSDVDAGEVIAPARVSTQRTPAGRFTNHSGTPNACFVRASGNIDLVALRPIRGCVGGDEGEEVLVDYRQALNVNRGEP